MFNRRKQIRAEPKGKLENQQIKKTFDNIRASF